VKRKAKAKQGAIRGRFLERGYDLRETPPEATRALIRTGCLDQYRVLFEPCAGKGAISRVLTAGGWRVYARDLIAYPGADADVGPEVNFFNSTPSIYDAIVTNPPYRWADDFIRHGIFKLKLPVYVLLRLMALEGANRSDVHQHLHHVFIGVERLPMMHRPDWKGKKLKQGAMPFGWFCFFPEKNQDGLFTASRISWREETKNDHIVDSSPPSDGPAGEAEKFERLLIEGAALFDQARGDR
jgi:hypothetical protein